MHNLPWQTRICNYCGLFIGWDDETMWYRPYGRVTDLDPPEEERWIHLDCWNDADEDRRDLTKRIAWQGPHRRPPWNAVTEEHTDG